MALILSSYMAVVAGSRPQIRVNDVNLVLTDAFPYIDESSNRMMVPVRVFSENLGCEVEYNQQLRLVKIKSGNIRILTKISEKYAIVNILGKSDFKADLDLSVALINGRSYLPLRFMAETLGFKVIWDATNGIVNVEKS